MTRTAQPALPTATLARIGVLGGISGGLLGGGTGVVTVPALAKAATLPRSVIHGTSTLANVSAAVVGSAVYAAQGGNIDAKYGFGLMIGGVLGAVLGAKLVTKMPENILKWTFVVILLVTALKMLTSAVGLDPTANSAALPYATLANPLAFGALCVVVGVIVGSWSAALGLGGGLLAVPALVILFGIGIHTAEGTSLLVMIPNAIIASLAHLKQGTATPRIGLGLAAFAAPGTAAGALIGLTLAPRPLAAIFGLYLLFIAIREVRRLRCAT